jgi:hypothetical protein
MTTPDFNDLTPPDWMELVWRNNTTTLPATTLAYQAGARHGYEQARQLWPEPITDRPPTEADADGRNAVQVVTETGNWAPWDWISAKLEKRPWLHTPRWQPRQPSLQAQALALLDPEFDGQPLTRKDADLIRRALEQAGEGVE